MLTELKPGIFYWQGGVNFGVVLGESGEIVLIDAGLDAGAPRKALRPFLEQGYRLAAVVATHCHADHVGGAAELHRRLGPAVYAPAPEHVILEHPDLAPMAIYGASPPPGLSVKFLRPPAPCPASALPREGPFEVAGRPMEIVPLPGHSPAQVGIAVDGVLFAGDGVFVPEVLERHPVLFLVRVDAFLASLDRLLARPEGLIVPGHGPHLDRGADPGGDGDPLRVAVEADRRHVHGIGSLILDILVDGPLGEDDLQDRLGARLGKTYDSDVSYYLDHAALRAHLSELARQGAVAPAYAGSRRRWQRVAGVPAAGTGAAAAADPG